ncbi:hypothetical protein Pelo_16417 [Pelomyxa schiedti]|nr:hypothetical protein Pelo_16417 [Pelomyxa schiedti]
MSYPGAPPISAQSGAQDRNRVPQQPANTSTYAMYGTASQYAGMTPQPQHFPASSPSHLQATPQVTVTTTQPQKTKKNLTVQKKNHGPQTPAKAPPKPKSQISPVPQVSKPSEPSDIVVDTTAPPGDANPCPPPSKRIRAPATTESGPLQSLALGGASTNPQPTSVATHLVPSPTSIQSTELSMGEGNVAAPPGPPLRVPLPGVGEKPDMEPKRLSQLQNMLGDQLTAMSKSFCSQTDVIKNQAISHLTERSELDVSSQTMLDDLAGKATSLLQECSIFQ